MLNRKWKGQCIEKNFSVILKKLKGEVIHKVRVLGGGGVVQGKAYWLVWGEVQLSVCARHNFFSQVHYEIEIKQRK